MSYFVAIKPDPTRGLGPPKVVPEYLRNCMPGALAEITLWGRPPDNIALELNWIAGEPRLKVFFTDTKSSG